MLRNLTLVAFLLGSVGCASMHDDDSSEPAHEMAAMSAQDAGDMDGMGEMGDMPMPTPSAEHLELQKSVGTWEGTLASFMPGMPETPMPAREVVRSAGPFWTMSEFTCDFMGMPYTGRGAFGFDPTTGKYTSTWFDNMSHYLAVMEGEQRADGVIIQNWIAPDMAGTMQPHRSEAVMHGDDAYTMTFYTAGEKSMVIAMKRTSN